MFRPILGPCIDCPKGTKSLLVVKAMRCAKHNRAFKDKNSPKNSSPTKRVFGRKITGERAVFERIFISRLHKCEVCGLPILRKKNSVDIFSHVLSKGAGKVLRLDEDFILLMGDGFAGNCLCHSIWEKRTKEMRKIDMWKPVFLLLDEAKKKAHSLRKNKPLYTETRVRDKSENPFGLQKIVADSPARRERPNNSG